MDFKKIQFHFIFHEIWISLDQAIHEVYLMFWGFSLDSPHQHKGSCLGDFHLIDGSWGTFTLLKRVKNQSYRGSTTVKPETYIKQSKK